MTTKEQAAHLVNQFLLKDIEFVDKKFNNFNSGYLSLKSTKILAQTEVINIIKILGHSSETINKKLNKNKEQNLTFKIVVAILLFGFFASIFYNAKLEQKNRLLSTEIDNVIIKSEKIMLLSLQQKSILDKHLKIRGLNKKEKMKFLNNEKRERKNNK